MGRAAARRRHSRTGLRLLSYQWQAEFFNNFLPGQVGGDVARGYAVAVDTHRTADAAASVLIDRFLGLLVFMGFAALATTAMLLGAAPTIPRSPPSNWSHCG